MNPVKLLIGTVTALILLYSGPVLSRATDLSATPIQVAVQSYNSTSAQWDAAGLQYTYWPESFRKQVTDKLVSLLRVGGRSVEVLDSRTPNPQADFQVVFIDVPDVYGKMEWKPPFAGLPEYPDVTPEILPNKHAANATEVTEFSTPWLKAKIYRQDGVPAGGIIQIFIAPFQWITQLHYASEGQWDKLLAMQTDSIDDLSIDGSKQQYLLKLESGHAYFGGPPEDPQYTTDIRTSLGDKAVVVAHLAKLSGGGEYIGSSYGEKKQECVKRSDDFYSKLIGKILNITIEANGSSDAPISAKDIESIANSSYGYNCFIN